MEIWTGKMNKQVILIPLLCLISVSSIYAVSLVSDARYSEPRLEQTSMDLFFPCFIANKSAISCDAISVDKIKEWRLWVVANVPPTKRGEILSNFGIIQLSEYIVKMKRRSGT